MVFVKDIIGEFEANWPALQNEYLSEYLADLLDIWRTHIRSSFTLIRNFHSLDPEVKETQPDDPVLYYLVHVAAIFSARDPFLMIPFNSRAILNGAEIAFHLMDALEQRCVKALTYVLCYFIINEEIETFRESAEKIITIFPKAANQQVDPTGEGQQLSPLTVAMFYGKVHMTLKLIKNGANVNEQVILNPNHGSIPVMFAAFHCNEEHKSRVADMVGNLMNSPHFKPELCIDNKGNNPVMYIVKSALDSQSLSAVVDFFEMANPADKSLYDSYGWSIALGSLAHSRILCFAPGFRANKTDSQGATYLMMAAQYNRPEVIEQLLEINQDLKSQELEIGYSDGLKRTAFSLAIGYGCHEVLSLLVQHADEWEINDRFGANPLFLAISFADPIAVSIILKHPQISLECPVGPLYPGLNVLEYAKNFGNPEILQLLDTKINN